MDGVAEMSRLSAGTYKIHNFWAVERFDDPKYNVNPHVPERPEQNGHAAHTVRKIDSSLETVGDAADFIAIRGGVFRKEYSEVSGINIEYMLQGGSEVENMPVTIKIGFEEYIKQGMPKVLSLTATPGS